MTVAVESFRTRHDVRTAGSSLGKAVGRATRTERRDAGRDELTTESH